MKALRSLLLGLLTLGITALSAAPASATFHEISIREIYPGSAGLPGSEYVELQMWTPGQNLVGGHSLETFGPTGTAKGTTTFAAKVPNGGNQSTILLATPAAESQFGVPADASMTPEQLDPAGGAVCWAESIDCVSWGSFSGSLPSPAGSPASPAGIPDGMALRRTISPACPTLLELGDDHDNSAADFSAVFPAPRPNSAAPSERVCGAGGGPPGSAGDDGPQGGHKAPQTSLKRKPPRKTYDRTPTFRFTSNEAGASFQCRLDSKPFRLCRSPFTSPKISLGRHQFEVRARDKSGRLDSSPAAFTFRVIPKRS